MFAPSRSRPPYFTQPAQLAWTVDAEDESAALQRPRTAQPPPPFHTEPPTSHVASRKRKPPAPTSARGKRATKPIPTQPAPLLTAALATHSLLHTLSRAIHDTAPPSQSTLQALYGDLLAVASHPSAQQAAGAGGGNGRHKHALLLRLIVSSVLWVELQGRGREELELVDRCCSHLAGLLVLSVNGRAAQSDDGSTATRAKKTERPSGGKPTVAEELHTYRNEMLARALPQCLRNSAQTLYHISLVGVHTDWAALASTLPSLPHLHHMHIQQCDISDEAAGVVLAALATGGVTHLSLSANRLTDAVVHPLCRLILNQGLRREDIEWQWRLRLADQRPAQPRGRRRSDVKAGEVRSDSIREQGLLSVDISGNCITNDGLLRLIDTLQDDCWLRAVLLHDNLHSEKAVAAFFGMLAHNTTLLHYSIMPIPPALPTPAFPPSSPRSRPTSPGAVLSAASPRSATSRFWSSLSSLSDPHFARRCAGLAEPHGRQLLLCPRLSLSDQSAARFGHGMRGQRDVQLVAAAEPARLLAVVETARPVSWDVLLRQKQEEIRCMQRGDSRPTSAAPLHSGRPIPTPADTIRPSSAASFSSTRLARPPTASSPSAPASRTCPPPSAGPQQPSSSSSSSRAGAVLKPLPLALLDSLFEQLEAVDSASATRDAALSDAQQQPDTVVASTDQDAGANRASGGQLVDARKEEAAAAAEWSELRQWASEQQRKAVVSFDHSATSITAAGGVPVVAPAGLEEQDEGRTSPSLVRPSGQVLSLSDLLDDD